MKQSQTHYKTFNYARARGGDYVSRTSALLRSAFSAFFCVYYSSGLISRFWHWAFLTLALTVTPAFAEKPAPKKETPARSFKQAMQDKSPEERMKAIEAFRAKKTGVTSEELKTMRNAEPNPMVRYRLNESMAEAELSNGGVELIDSLLNDAEPVVRQGAAQKLGNYTQNLSVVHALSQGLRKDTSRAVRSACAISLGLSKSAPAISALEKGITDSDANVRLQVAKSLKRLATPYAEKILKRMQKDSDARVREMAGGAR